MGAEHIAFDAENGAIGLFGTVMGRAGWVAVADDLHGKSGGIQVRFTTAMHSIS
jgi:hypothetical protein